MQVKYTIFKTKWGYFGLAAGEKGILRTCLPCPSVTTVKKQLLKGLDNPEFDKNLLKSLQKQIIGYFEGRPSKSSLRSPSLRAQRSNLSLNPQSARRTPDGAIRNPKSPLSSVLCPLNLSCLPAFSKAVLMACKQIPPGKTITYSHLAGLLGNPRAARAVGNALAKNPLPLIIPCHRVIRNDGKIGNFSAPGGTNTKRKLIDLERV